jgi:hypothetical protein
MNAQIVYAGKNLLAEAKPGVNTVGWVDIGNGPELRIYVHAKPEWITADEHKRRKDERRKVWLESHPQHTCGGGCHHVISKEKKEECLRI